MNPLWNVLGKVLRTTLLASAGTLFTLLTGVAEKLSGSHVDGSIWELIAFSVASGAVTGLIAGLKRYLGYKATLDPYVPPR